MAKILVRKIRPTDPGFNTPASRVWPWLVFPDPVSRPGSAWAFKTWKAAIRRATSGDATINQWTTTRDRATRRFTYNPRNGSLS